MIWIMKLFGVLAGFAASAGIGPMRCGASLTELVAELGVPLDLGPTSGTSKPRRWPHRFCYGDVELLVCSCRLVDRVSISTWHDSPVEIPGELVPFEPYVTYAQLTGALDRPWERFVWVREEEPTVRTLSDDGVPVEFSFFTELGEIRLHKAYARAEPHDCPPIPPGQPDDGLGLIPR
jgi:hypothetical protein